MYKRLDKTFKKLKKGYHCYQDYMIKCKAWFKSLIRPFSHGQSHCAASASLAFAAFERFVWMQNVEPRHATVDPLKNHHC